MRRFVLVVALVVAAGGGAALWLRAEGGVPEIRGPQELFVGRSPKPLVLELADVGSGLRHVRVSVAHAGGEAVIDERGFPGDLLWGGGPAAERLELPVDPKALALGEGAATLRVAARDWSWRDLLRGNAGALEIPLVVDLAPARLAIQTGGLTYVRRGGAALVIYTVGEPAVRDGVEVAERFFFPGIDWPAACAGCRLSLFAVPIDAPEDPPIRVIAEDRAGNRSSASWATRLQPHAFPQVPIQLTRGFLETKIGELAQQLEIDATDRVATFQDINSRIRARDEARIRELATGPAGPPLWRGAFQQLADSKVTSLFPERRRYLLDGKLVSEATHYGFDLASLAGAPITASNAGRVLFTGNLGIYGETVLVDHGLGIVSLYAHLASIEVSPGEEVAQGQRLGLSGQTGLAGGDHLHFAILVGGVYVDPREWWDPKWVREHVEAHLGR
jgi:murein DD-endopeptidase MepM/ murein hydrolase activator NlpD